MQCCMAFLYWSGVMTWRRMIIINMAATVLLTAYLALRLHESPQFLYSKGKFTELKACLENIATRNGVYNPSQIENITVRLSETKRREDEAMEGVQAD